MKHFVLFWGYFTYFPHFWYIVPRKIWQPYKKSVFHKSAFSLTLAGDRVTRLGEFFAIEEIIAETMYARTKLGNIFPQNLQQ
jgi:uncharacterized metal-binding protein